MPMSSALVIPYIFTIIIFVSATVDFVQIYYFPTRYVNVIFNINTLIVYSRCKLFTFVVAMEWRMHDFPIYLFALLFFFVIINFRYQLQTPVTINTIIVEFI